MMRLSKTSIVIVALSLLTMACAPRGQWHHHGPPCMGGPGMHGAMGYGCGPESCAYKSRCFSNGAVLSNDGVCQACNDGKWVSATGCSEHAMCGACAGCPMMKGGKPGPCPGGPGPCHPGHGHPCH